MTKTQTNPTPRLSDEWTINVLLGITERILRQEGQYAPIVKDSWRITKTGYSGIIVLRGHDEDATYRVFIPYRVFISEPGEGRKVRIKKLSR